jgi:hypothetical protein
VKYNDLTTVPTNAGSYEVTVDVSGVANYANVSGLSLGTYVINKASPLYSHLEYELPEDVIYDGTAQGIAAPELLDSYTGMGKITVKYNGFTTVPTDAGSYDVTVDINGGANFNPVVGLLLGRYVIDKATPKTEYLNYRMLDEVVYFDGLPHSLAVAAKAEYAAHLGVVTVKYNGSEEIPVLPGVYVVTIAFAEGKNYVAGEFEVGRFLIYDLPASVISRRVTIESPLYYDVSPSPGSFYIESGRTLTLTLTPRPSLPEGYVPLVTTDRVVYSDDYPSAIKITANADGTYTVRIAYIIEETVVTIAAVSPDSPTANDPSATVPQVWGYGGRLYIRSATTGRAAVYNLSGQQVKALPFAAGETLSQPMPAGIYIVRIGERNYKVVLH